MKAIRRHLAVALVASLGVTGTLLAVARSPDRAAPLADGEGLLATARVDLGRIGYRADRSSRVFVTSGSRYYPASADVAVLTEREPDPAERRRRLAEVPPLRLGVRFWDAVGPEGFPGGLLLEYGPEGELQAASFGWDGVVRPGLQPVSPPEFAERLARILLGREPPEPEERPLGGGIEYLFRGAPGQRGAYVYLGGSSRWIAALQPEPYFLLGRGFGLQSEGYLQAFLFGLLALGALGLGVLFWRLARRRAGFGHGPLLLAILLFGLLPAIGHLPRGVFLWQFLFLYLLVHAGVFLAWAAAEAELREVRPGSVEHWDRVLRRLPTRDTARELLVGLGLGAGLAGWLSISGELAATLGGGWGTTLLILPEHWLLPTAPLWGITLAVATVFLVGLGGRLTGRAGAIAGAAVGGMAWSLAVPVHPPGLALAGGVLASLAIGAVAWHRGLLTAVVAAVTALCLPSAVVAWGLFPYRSGTALISTAPLVLAGLAWALLRRAPEEAGPPEAVAPTYVSELEREARLDAEVGLLRDLQLSLLPPADLWRGALSSGARVDVAWRMIPADTVGGDFLDLIEDADGRLWLAIADVAGHGISCSLLTAFTKAAVSEHAIAGVEPTAALARIRKLFGRLRIQRTLVTLLLATWDPVQRRLAVASAGHPPLLVLTGGELRELGATGRPLGNELEGRDLQDEMGCPGETVIVGYSDGVPEAVSPGGDTLGYRVWPAVLGGLGPRRAEVVLETLLAEVASHRAGRAAEDDITAVVLRV